MILVLTKKNEMVGMLVDKIVVWMKENPDIKATPVEWIYSLRSSLVAWADELDEYHRVLSVRDQCVCPDCSLWDMGGDTDE